MKVLAVISFEFGPVFYCFASGAQQATLWNSTTASSAASNVVTAAVDRVHASARAADSSGQSGGTLKTINQTSTRFSRTTDQAATVPRAALHPPTPDFTRLSSGPKSTQNPLASRCCQQNECRTNTSSTYAMWHVRLLGGE
jgi:hypothetical protein